LKRRQGYFALLDAQCDGSFVRLAPFAFLGAGEHLVGGVQVEIMFGGELSHGFALLIQPFARLLWGSEVWHSHPKGLKVFNTDEISSTFVELSTGNGAHLLNFGERLKEERRRLGFNQEDFGALGGVTKTTQLNYEKGSRHPDAPYLAAIAENGVDVLYVLTGRRTPALEGSLTEEEASVLDHYRKLPAPDQAAVERLTTALAETAAVYGVSKEG